MKHRKLAKEHSEEDEAVARVFRCVSLVCSETTRLYDRFNIFRDDHQACIKSKKGTETQSAVKTKVLLLQKRKKNPGFGDFKKGKQNV